MPRSLITEWDLTVPWRQIGNRACLRSRWADSPPGSWPCCPSTPASEGRAWGTSWDSELARVGWHRCWLSGGTLCSFSPRPRTFSRNVAAVLQAAKPADDR